MPRLNLSIRSKLFLGLGLTIAGFGTLGLIAARTLNESSVGSPVYDRVVMGKDLLADILPPPAYIIESYLTVLQMEQETDRATIDKHAALLGTLAEAFKQRETHWDDNLPTGELREVFINESSKHAGEFLRVCQQRFIPLMKEGKYAEAKLVLSGDLERLYREHRASIDKAVTLATDFSANQEKEALAVVTAGRSTLWTVGISIAAIVGFVSWLISRGIVRGLAAIKTITEVEGDLTRRIQLDSRDELGHLAAWLNGFVQSLHDMIAQVVITSKQVSQSTESIESAGRAMASASSAQSQQTTQTSTAIEEMSVSIVEVARKAAESAAAASNAREASNSGAEVVRGVVDGIRGLAKSVTESSTAIDSLGQRGQQIGSIIETIEDIADQTNLLALNAAIEAARAGEHGRGFAVVADEVRKLAERTMKATQEVSDSIRSIQADTSSAIGKMNSCAEAVQSGVEMAQRAGLSLDTITAGSSEITSMIQSIAAATEEQSAASEEITRNIAGMAETGRQNAEQAKLVSSTAETLARSASSLLGLVVKFKINPASTDPIAEVSRSGH